MRSALFSRVTLVTALSVSALALGAPEVAAHATTTPHIASSVGSGLYEPTGIAVDSAGDVYVADTGNSRVVKITPADVQTVVASSLSRPMGVAVDAAGDVFIALNGSNHVMEVTASGTKITFATTVVSADSVVVNSSGTIYVSGYQQIYKLVPKGTVGADTATSYAGINPAELAIDASGNVYAADNVSSAIDTLSTAGNLTFTPLTQSHPHALARDAAGDFFVNDTAGSIDEITPGGTTTILSTGGSPNSLAVDSSGNVYVTNETQTSVQVIAANSTPPSLITLTAPTITNLPSNPTFGSSFVATVTTNSDGALSITSSTPSVCSVSAFTVTLLSAGTCTLTAHVAASTDMTAADGSPQSFTITGAVPQTVSISNLPAYGLRGATFTALVHTDGDGVTSVISTTQSICTTSQRVVTYVASGTCTLVAAVAAGTNYAAGNGTPQSFPVYKYASNAPTISNAPATGIVGKHLSAVVTTNGTGTKSVSSTTLGVCTVSGLVVTYQSVGSCKLVAAVAGSTNFQYAPATGKSQLIVVKK